MAREFSRQSFHDLVWSKPITHIAKDFALSDVAIHKICRKHAIPTPPPGWWARKQAGKPVERTALPSTPKGLPDRIVIAAPELRGDGASIAAVREDARVKASAFAADAGARDNPIIDATIKALRAAEPSYKGLLATSGPDVIRCEVCLGSLERLRLILSRVVAAAELQGFVLRECKAGAEFFGAGETISLRIEEAVKRIKHVLTPAEQKLEDAWQAKVERERRRSNWDWDWSARPVFPEWDFVSTGQLGFEMGKVYVQLGQGPRSTFRDAKVQRLENMAEDISVALAVLAASQREERERRAQAERMRLEERRLREMPLREAFVQERRREGLDAVMAELASLDYLRGLMSRLETFRPDDASARVSMFVEWARAELAAREEALSGAGLERRFEAGRLFGDDDDHEFKSPHWY